MPPGYAPDKAVERVRARKLLAEAGFPNGLKATTLVRRGQQVPSAASPVKDQFGQVGIDVNLQVCWRPRPSTSAWRRLRRDGRQFPPPSTIPTPSLARIISANAGRNYSGMCVEAVEKLYLQQSQIRQISVRLPVVHQLHLAAMVTR